MAAGTVYIFIKNTDAPQYIIEWKPAGNPNWDPADMVVVNKNGTTYTTTTITVANTSVDYNFRMRAKCLSKQADYYYLNLAGICGTVTVEAEWNNCICPNITGITITG